MVIRAGLRKQEELCNQERQGRDVGSKATCGMSIICCAWNGKNASEEKGIRSQPGVGYRFGEPRANDNLFSKVQDILLGLLSVTV